MTTAAQVWNYTLSNGLSAQQTLIDENDMSAELRADPWGWQTILEGGLSAGDLIRIISAVAKGRTHVSTEGEQVHIAFDSEDGSHIVVAADMRGSERVTVTVTP